MKPILVIGATGTVGSAVAGQLAAEGAAVRALSRNPAGAQLPAGVKTVAGDLTAPETLDAGLDGVEAVFVVWTAPAGAVAGALERITGRVRRVVLLSSPHKTAHPLLSAAEPGAQPAFGDRAGDRGVGGRVDDSAAGDVRGECAGVVGAADPGGEVVRWPYLEVPTAPIHERDIAAVAARALLEDGHAAGICDDRGRNR